MRSILVLLILVMIGLNGKGQSVTALPDSVLSQCCLEVTLLNGNVTTVDWVFIQYVTRDGTGTKLFVEYAPNFGGIQWETQIRIQDDFDGVLERSKFIMLPFTVGSTDYAINRNWIANIEENTATGGTWIYGRFGTPTKRKFSAVEDYETLKNLLLACRPRAIVVAENGLYTEGDTVRMGGFLIENTTITTEGYNWMMKDTLSKTEFGLDYLTAETGDTTVYWARRSGSVRQMMQMGNRYWYNTMKDTVGGLFSDLTHSWNSGDPFLKYLIFNALDPNSGTAWFQIQKDNAFLIMSNETTNPYYTPGWAVTNNTVQIGVNENGSGDPGNGVLMGAFGDGTSNEYLFLVTKNVDNNIATNGQFLQLTDDTNGKVEFATIDLSGYLPIADTAAMLSKYIERGDTSLMLTNYVTFGNLSGYPTGTGTADRLARWTATNTLAAGNLSDNGTRLAALLPWQFQTYTTAGLPTGVAGYHVYNTTTNGPGWYQGSRWAYGLESTANRFTTGSLIFADANGQVNQDNANLFWDDTNNRLGVLTATPSFPFHLRSSLNSNVNLGVENTNSGTGAAAQVVMVNNSGTVMGAGVSSSAYTTVATIGANAGYFYANGAGGFAVVSPSGGSFRFASSNTVERWRIQTTGYIGHGITTPLSYYHMVPSYSGTANLSGAGYGYQMASATYTDVTGNGTFSDASLFSLGGGTINSPNATGGRTFTNLATLRIENRPLAGTNVTITNPYALHIVAGNSYFGGSVGISTPPTQDFDVNGDAYIRDSTRLTTTPAHSAITGLLTRDANGWVGLATLSGLSYSGGVLTGVNIYNTSDSIRGNRYLKMASAATTAIGNWPSFPSRTYGTSEYGINISPVANGSVGIQNGFNYVDVYNNVIEINSLGTNVNISGNDANFNVTPKSLPAISYGFIIDSTGIRAQASGGVYKFPNPNTSSPVTGTGLKQNLVWTAGVPDFEYIKKDTTIYVDDADYDWSAAITTAQIATRFNRIIFWMTTTAGAGSDSELTLHTPDANLMQVEYLIHSVDEAGGFDNRIIFGTNNAVSSTNTLATNYYPSAGQGVHIRAGLRSGVYKYRYSN